MACPDTMDPECVPLCDALNRLPGIHTLESCCGHGESTFLVAFSAAAVESLRPILIAIDENSSWHVKARLAVTSIYFVLTGVPDVDVAPLVDLLVAA